MPLLLEPLILGTHCYFIRDGTVITVPAGTSGTAVKPGPTEPLWLDFGAIETSSEVTNSEEKKCYAPSPGHLELRKRVVTKLERVIKFTTVDYGPLVIEFGSRSAALTASSTAFVALAAGTKLGWLKVQRYDEDDAVITTETIYCQLEIDGEITYGDDFVRASFTATGLKNALSAGTILS